MSLTGGSVPSPPLFHTPVPLFSTLLLNLISQSYFFILGILFIFFGKELQTGLQGAADENQQRLRSRAHALSGAWCKAGLKLTSYAHWHMRTVGRMRSSRTANVARAREPCLVAPRTTRQEHHREASPPLSAFLPFLLAS